MGRILNNATTGRSRTIFPTLNRFLENWTRASAALCCGYQYWENAVLEFDNSIFFELLLFRSVMTKVSIVLKYSGHAM